MIAPALSADDLRARFEEKVADGSVPDNPELRARFEQVLTDPMFEAALVHDNNARPDAAATPGPVDPVKSAPMPGAVPVRDAAGMIVDWKAAEVAEDAGEEPADPTAEPEPSGYADPGPDAAADRAEWQTRPRPADLYDTTIFEEAEAIVGGDRENTYGPPERNLGRIARAWGAYLETTLDVRDVAWMMVMMKASRDRHSRKRDNLVDGAGYLRLIERTENHC